MGEVQYGRLFESVGKKISDVAEDFGKKTEDTLEVQRIKSQIRSLDRANERDYIEIGKKIYQNSKQEKWRT